MLNQNSIPTSNQNSGPEGLSGWLAILAITIVFNPLFLLLTLIGAFNEIFVKSSITEIFSFQSSLGILVILEICFVLFLFCLSIYNLISFFKKRLHFPKYQIIFLLTYILFSIFDTVFVALSTGILDVNGRLIINIITNIIWIFYLLRSVRVKNTFIN